jgi:DnaJ homolog subfamily C member 19
VQLAIIVVGLGLLGWFFYWVGKDLEPRVRKRVMGWALVPVLIVGLLLAIRFGAHWFPIIAAGAWALLRRGLPLLMRAAPFAWSRWSKREPHARGGSPGGSDHREARTAAHRGMTRSEALEVLGLPEGATRSEVLAQYKKLIKHAHPDKPGGSHYFAAKLNQAKSVLLT